MYISFTDVTFSRFFDHYDYLRDGKKCGNWLCTGSQFVTVGKGTNYLKPPNKSNIQFMTDHNPLFWLKIKNNRVSE